MDKINEGGGGGGINIGRNILIGTIELEKLKNKEESLFCYQRIVNNWIAIAGLTKSGDPYYPYCDYDKKGNIFLVFDKKKLTGTDPKIIDVQKVNKKIEESICLFTHQQETLKNITQQIKRIVLQHYEKTQKQEVENKTRHAYKDMKFEGGGSQGYSIPVMEGVYNLMGNKRMDYFNYQENTGLCTINKKGKDRLLKLLYEELESMNKNRFISVENIFPGSDYIHIKNRKIEAEDLTKDDIIALGHYLLSAHHSIDQIMEIYIEENTRKPDRKLSKGVKIFFQNRAIKLLEKVSTKHKIGQLFNEDVAKAYSSKLKKDRGNLAIRAFVARPILYDQYNFDLIEGVHSILVPNIIQNLEKKFENIVKCVKERNKDTFSGVNKLMRFKHVSEYLDQIGLQIFVDLGQIPTNEQTIETIAEIYRTINQNIHNYTIDIDQETYTAQIEHITIDNKNIVTDEGNQEIQKKLASDYAIDLRKQTNKKHETIDEDKDIQEYIIHKLTQGSKGGNGSRSSHKEVIQYGLKNKNGNIVRNLGGIEPQIIPYGISINKNEAAHEFLDTQKIIDLDINGNKTCGFDVYCEKKDVAITTRANNLKKIRKRLENHMEKEYTRDMYDTERYYTIPIQNHHKEFIEKNITKRDKNVLHIKDNTIYINLLQLEELRGSISKRRAADLIIIEQANKELQSGKVIQYQYHQDMNKKILKQIGKNNQHTAIIDYPMIDKITRDEKGEVQSNIRFINKESVTSIEAGQTPANGYVIIPSEKYPGKGYAQKIPNLARALKHKDITLQNMEGQLYLNLATPKN